MQMILPIGGALAVIVVLIVLLAGGGDDATQTPPNRVVTTGGTATGTNTPPTKAETVVTVLNGTLVTGLAGQLRDQLVAKGYEVLKTTNAVDQTQATSQVAYATGYESAARTVARVVGIPTSEVVPMDPNTRVEAGDKTRVVVIVGADTAAKAQ